MRVRHLACLVALACAVPGLADDAIGGGARADGADAAGAGADGPDGPDAPDAPGAVELVSAMSEAVHALDYEGTFVHMAQGHLSSMRILHASEAGGERERMSALDGEAREVVRDHSLVTCIFPASASMTVAPSKPRRALPEIGASLGANPSYAVELVGDDRVAGRATRVVRIRPVDALRYGYRFWIDAETHMLLRSMLLDERGRTLEEVLFTDIEYVDGIDPARFEVPPEAKTSDWLEHGIAEAGRPPASGAVERIGFAALPRGYEKLGESYRPMPTGGAPVSHAMLSDGLASVSVYVEHLARGAQDRSVEGASRIGGVSAYGTSLEAGFVTVVGEVPPATVRAIAGAVRLAD